MPHPHPIPVVEDAEHRIVLTLVYPKRGSTDWRNVECYSPRHLHNAMKRVPHYAWFDAIVCLEAESLTDSSDLTLLNQVSAGPIDIVLARLMRKCKSELDTTDWQDTEYTGDQTVRLEEAMEWLHKARQMALEY